MAIFNSYVCLPEGKRHMCIKTKIYPWINRINRLSNKGFSNFSIPQVFRRARFNRFNSQPRKARSLWWAQRGTAKTLGSKGSSTTVVATLGSTAGWTAVDTGVSRRCRPRCDLRLGNGGRTRGVVKRQKKSRFYMNTPGCSVMFCVYFLFAKRLKIS